LQRQNPRFNDLSARKRKGLNTHREGVGSKVRLGAYPCGVRIRKGSRSGGKGCTPVCSGKKGLGRGRRFGGGCAPNQGEGKMERPEKGYGTSVKRGKKKGSVIGRLTSDSALDDVSLLGGGGGRIFMAKDKRTNRKTRELTSRKK